MNENLEPSPAGQGAFAPATGDAPGADAADAVAPGADAAEAVAAEAVAAEADQRQGGERRREETRTAALISEVALCLIERGDLGQVLQAIAEALVRHLDAAFARVWTLDEAAQMLELRASAGQYTHLDGPHARVPVGRFKIGLIAQENLPHLTNDVPNDARIHDHDWAQREGLQAFAGYPLAVEGRVVGVMALFSRQPLAASTLEMLTAIANGVALGIERKAADAALLEKSELLQKVNEIGQLLAQELEFKKLAQAVIDAATELTHAEMGSFFYQVAGEGSGEGSSEGEPASAANPPRTMVLFAVSGEAGESASSELLPGLRVEFGPAFAAERPVRSDDARREAEGGAFRAPFALEPEQEGPASYLAVPVGSRSGEVAGGLFLCHREPGRFRVRDEEGVQALATQAAIAMDNARLFQALEAERARATAAAADNQRLYDEAERANRAKDEFLATVSHELRTPLTAILGWTNMLMGSHQPDPATVRALEIIDRNARAQAQIVEDILDISRIITGKLRLDVRLLDPGEVIRAAVESMRPAAEAKKIRLQLLLDPRAAPVSGDPERLQQVVWNLVSNAVKFTDKGGKVKVCLERVNSHIELAVSDDGAGISDDFVNHVFDRFRQADATTTRAYGGLGLGLAIVRQIVELHGGSVRAVSPGVGQGSTFTVSLPLAVVHRTPDQAETARVHPGAGGTRPTFAPSEVLQGRRVLVVDDEPDTRFLLQHVLKSAQAEVLVVADAEAALAAIESFAPDVLVSDIGMPGTDGYELIKLVRERERAAQAPRLPALALTAFTRVEDRMRVLAAGFQMHVPKPVEPAELVAIVASVVSNGP